MSGFYGRVFFLCGAFVLSPWAAGEGNPGTLATGAGMTGVVLHQSGNFVRNPSLGNGTAGMTVEVDSALATSDVPGGVGFGVDFYGQSPLGPRIGLALGLHWDHFGVAVRDWSAGWNESSLSAAVHGILVPERADGGLSDIRVGLGLALQVAGGGDQDLARGQGEWAGDLDLGLSARLGVLRLGLSALSLSGSSRVGARSVNLGVAYAPMKPVVWELTPVLEGTWFPDRDKMDLRVGLLGKPFANLSLRLGAAFLDSFSQVLPTAGVSFDRGGLGLHYTLVVQPALAGPGDHRLGVTWKWGGGM